MEIDFADTFALGQRGSAVQELHRRLSQLGYEVPSESAVFTENTQHALVEFQIARGLDADGSCTETTWRALIEASFVLGDRLLYETSPMMRGEDVSELQLKLGTLGFDAGRVDGIFGPNTRRAVADFQRNLGLVTDDVCGPEVVAHLRRLATRGTHISVAGLREREQLRAQPRSMRDLRIALGHIEDDHNILGPLGAQLQSLGAEVTMISATNWSDVAQQTNAFEATMCLGLSLSDKPGAVAQYFGTEGFESTAGRLLAERILEQLPAGALRTHTGIAPMRSPLLRETRCPAVLLQIGPVRELDDLAGQINTAIHRAIISWSSTPSF